MTKLDSNYHAHAHVDQDLGSDIDGDCHPAVDCHPNCHLDSDRYSYSDRCSNTAF